MLGEFIEKSTPDVCVKYVIKDNTEWGEFVDSVQRSYGFERKSCPLVYTIEGTLIGDGRAFIEHVREKYGKTLTVTKESQKNRTRLNIDENEERMRKKKEGDTLGEKIEATLEKIKKKNVSQLLDDCFYEEVYEKGIPFKLRRSNFLRDMTVQKETEDGEPKTIHINKTMNVVDEILQR